MVAFLGILIVPSFASADTVAALQAQINALMAQIQSLQAQLAQLQGTTQTWCHNFDVNLKFGMVGSEVAALQTALEKEGFSISSDEKNNQNFDESTASAVSGFQQKYADEILTPLGLKYGTGFVGKATRAKLNALYGCKTINKPPVISGISGPTVLKVDETGTWIVKATDPENGPLTYTVEWGDELAATAVPSQQKISTYTQTATFSHSYSKAGIYNPTFTVTDNQGLSVKTSISVNIEEVSQPILSISPTNLIQGNTYVFEGILTNAPTASNVYFYLQKPDGTMKENGRYIGRTDSSGHLYIETSQNIFGGQTGIYKAWVRIGEIATCAGLNCPVFQISNIIEFNVSAPGPPLF